MSSRYAFHDLIRFKIDIMRFMKIANWHLINHINIF